MASKKDCSKEDATFTIGLHPVAGERREPVLVAAGDPPARVRGRVAARTARFWRSSTRLVLLVLTSAILGALAPAVSEAQTRAPSPQPPASSTRRPVQLALRAGSGSWRTALGGTRAELRLDQVSRETTVIATSPRFGYSFVGLGSLQSDWKAFASRSGGWVDGSLATSGKAGSRLYAMRLRLVNVNAGGTRGQLRFVAERAPRGTARYRAWPGPDALELRDVTVLVSADSWIHEPGLQSQSGTGVAVGDAPTITDQIRALWQSLLAFFLGNDSVIPPNPTSLPDGTGQLTFDNGDGVWAGPQSAPVDTPRRWQAVQQENLDEGAPKEWTGDLGENSPDLSFTGSRYGTDGDGVPAVFDHDWGTLVWQAAKNAVADIPKVAVFDSSARSVTFDHAEVGAANFRALVTDTLTVSDSGFNRVDLTGAEITGTGGESTIRDSVLSGLTADRRVLSDKNVRDRATERLDTGKSFLANKTDFVNTRFQNSDFNIAQFRDTTFRGCALDNVDFDNAKFSGTDPADNPDDRFQPTFDNSEFEKVDFDGAQLTNVSFAGADFSGGDVSLDGAKLDDVDFTGAIGLQDVDWTKVTVDGPVYGLAQYGHLLTLDDPADLRSITFDGDRPKVDPDTGFDIQPHTDYLIDPESGVRLERGTFGELVPIDPRTGEPLRDPGNGEPLAYENRELINPTTGEHFEINYDTGELAK